MKNTEHGQITRLCAGGQFIAATGITGAVNARTQSNYTAEGLNQNGAAHKTKATPKDRQWHRTKQAQDNRNSTTTPALNVCLAGGAYSCSLGFRRWRRLISPSIAEMINCDVLSPGSFTFSIPSTVSCGTRARSACDFAFTLPVAIYESPLVWCRPSYTKKSYIQLLTCRPPRAILLLSGLH